jgi:hypothetical protein
MGLEIAWATGKKSGLDLKKKNIQDDLFQKQIKATTYLINLTSQLKLLNL